MINALPIDPETGMRRPRDGRQVVHDSAVVRVIDISATYEHPPRGLSDANQVVLPYLGVFAYGLGRRSALIDPNRILMAPANVDFTDTHPVRGVGHAVMVVKPAPDVLEEICHLAGSTTEQMFSVLSRPSNPATSLATQRLRMIDGLNLSPLQADELAIGIVRDALGASEVVNSCPRPVVARAKQVLHERACDRVGLSEVARSVGVSPVYLTQEFTRTEGVSLYRYQILLRLSKALVELPFCNDITGLALDLGFSSHSHFAAAFRRTFAMTPTAFRAQHRRVRSHQVHLASAQPDAARRRSVFG